MGQKIVSRLFVRLLATIGALVLLAAIAGAASFLIARRSIPSKVILELDLEHRLVEYVPDDPVARIVSGRTPTMLGLIEALQRAATDHRVVGLIARVGEAGLPLADVQEIRDAVIAFRHTGKPAIAYAETFGEGGNANGSYYLATAFDKIYLQPSGELGLAGLLFERSFLRGTLDKLGFVPRLDHRSEYKSAMNVLTEKKFTAAHREANEKIMESQFGQIVTGIARARNLSEDKVRALIDRGPFLGDEALDAKLVDKLGYRDAAYDDIRKKAGPHTKFLYLSKYLNRAGSPYDDGATVALIYGVGGVKRGKSGYDPIFEEVTMGADTVAAAFRAAATDKSVKAILFRIDSGGGSYVASDTIWREVARAKKAGKPIIVSMGAVAGSGGYFIALPADKIVAQPATLTASIGVIRRQVPHHQFLGQTRHHLGRSPLQLQRHGLLRPPRFHPRTMGAIRDMARPHLRRFHHQGRRRPQASQGKGPRNRQGTRLDRRGRQSPRIGGRTRRIPRRPASRARSREVARRRQNQTETVPAQKIRPRKIPCRRPRQ